MKKSISLLIVVVTLTPHAQKSILPYNYTEWKQPITQINTIPLFRYDTTANGVRMIKVAELTNGVLIVFDSAQAEIIINNEYLKIKRCSRITTTPTM